MGFPEGETLREPVEKILFFHVKKRCKTLVV